MLLRGILSAAGLKPGHSRNLMDWDENTTSENYILLFGSISLVIFAGLMSGLTLGKNDENSKSCR